VFLLGKAHELTKQLESDLPKTEKSRIRYHLSRIQDVLNGKITEEQYNRGRGRPRKEQ